MEQGATDKELPVQSAARWGGRLVIVLLLGALLGLGYLVLRNFLVPLLWAAVLVYVTWPLNRRLRGWLKGRASLAALVMTVVLAFAIILPLLVIIVSLREELQNALESFRALLAAGSAGMPGWLRELPILGPRIVELTDRIAVEPEVVGEWLAERASMWVGEAADLVVVIGRNAMKFAFALIAAFFFYRDGEALVGQSRRGLYCLLGRQTSAYWDAAAGMTQAVVYGLVLTALAQGVIAGFGYWAAGLDAPVLLGAMTALFALVPFGAPAVWVTVALWLLWQAQIWAGIGLLVWGALVVSSVDNVVRPLVISASAHISFLLVLFGVLGGLNAFGLIGLFLGPVVLAVLWAVWQHWLERNEVACADSGQ